MGYFFQRNVLLRSTSSANPWGTLTGSDNSALTVCGISVRHHDRGLTDVCLGHLVVLY